MLAVVMILIVPPHWHVIELLSVTAGCPAILTTVLVPDHCIVGITGTHGIGVSTPMAADVAAATSGLLVDVHMVNEGTASSGVALSLLNDGVPLAITVGTPAASGIGAIPLLQRHIDPVFTSRPVAGGAAAAASVAVSIDS